MSSNGIGTSAPERWRMLVSRWVIRLAIALLLSMLVLFFFFTSGAISR